MLVSSPEEVSTSEVLKSSAADCEYEASLKKSATILVVDDNKVIADTTSAILNRFGFCAITAYDGVTALRMAVETSPDILLSDIVMPILNGVELAISVRKILPGTAILLFSTQAATEDILEDAKREGYSFEVVGKPIHPDELVYRLHRLHRNSRPYN
jgi:DNA-binding response OmpR family regulator